MGLFSVKPLPVSFYCMICAKCEKLTNTHRLLTAHNAPVFCFTITKQLPCGCHFPCRAVKCVNWCNATLLLPVSYHTIINATIAKSPSAAVDAAAIAVDFVIANL